MTQMPHKSALLYLFLVNICCFSWLSEVVCAVERSSTPPTPPHEVDANVGLPTVDLGESERRDVTPDIQRLSKDSPDLLLAHLPGEPDDPAREGYRRENTHRGSALPASSAGRWAVSDTL